MRSFTLRLYTIHGPSNWMGIFKKLDDRIATGYGYRPSANPEARVVLGIPSEQRPETSRDGR